MMNLMHKRYFYVSFYIFISMGRATLIFLLDTFFGGQKVFQVSSKYVENNYLQFWSRLIPNSAQKSEKLKIFRDAPKSVSKIFSVKF